MDVRIPPQNIEAERAVIGAILIDNSTLNKVADILKPDFFYDLRHATLFEAITSLYAEGKPVDVLTITAELKKKHKTKQAGGSDYLSEIISSVPTSANVEVYAGLVKEASIRRRLITFAGKLDEISRAEDRKIEEILDELESNVLVMSQDSTKADFYNSRDLLNLYIELADEYERNPDSLRGIPTGLRELDKMLNGWHRSDLVILAARPSVGKSAFAFDVARHAAVNEGKTIAIFSLEMAAIQVMQRMLAQQSGISLWDLKTGKKFESESFSMLNTAIDKLSSAKIFIDETAGINIMQLRSKTRKLKLEHNLDLVVIDYLQLMQGTGRSSDNRAQEVGEISRSLKILARELNVPIIALSQLNRAVENRQDRVPQLSDLRESGSIEQDADIVIFLGRDMPKEGEVIDPDAPIKVDIFVAKHRNGATGRFSLNYVGKRTKFIDREEE